MLLIGEAIADELGDLKNEQDAMTADILLFNAKIADEIGLELDPSAKLANDMFFLAFTDNDAVLGAAISTAIDALREDIAQPPAATTAEILTQVTDIQRAHTAALMLLRTRMDALRTFTGGTSKRVMRMTGDALTRLEQRRDAIAAQIDVSEAEGAEVTQPGRGRPPKREWSDAEIRGLHAAYLVRDEQTATQFAKRNHLAESQMFKLFRRVGITKKGTGIYDSEL